MPPSLANLVFSSRFRKQNNITRDHGSVVVIGLGHLERKMNLIGEKKPPKKKKAGYYYEIH
jgi:hypothetical protein